MVVGLGIDLVRISRVRAAWARDERGLESVLLTARERDSGLDPDPGAGLATRIAIKEAVLKALGSGILDLASWREIEVTATGPAFGVVLTDRALESLKARGGRRALVSCRRAGDWALAGAVLES